MGPPVNRMNLRQLGEFGLLHRIRRRIPDLSRAVRIGMGDDAAVFRTSSGRDLILTNDMLVEGIDFDFARGATHRQVGYKALAVNLSDVAAMGGRPRAFIIGLAIPGSTSVQAAEDLYRGMLTLARQERIDLVGGDTSASRKGLVISVSVLGEVEEGHALTRSGARVGDRIYVSGTLGDSRAGLELLKKRRNHRAGKRSRMEAVLIRRHLYPPARIELGRLLGRRRWATGMIDLSDGLASDLRHLCSGSRVGAQLELNRLPVSQALGTYADRNLKSPADYALRGGEDFELLFTVPMARTKMVESAAAKLGLPITSIGSIVPRNRRIILIRKDGREMPLTLRGYEHFHHTR